jgi:hypothetical protein
VACAHLMFGLPPFSASEHIRSGGSQVFSEFVVAFGLLAVIWGVVRSRPTVVPFAVGAYITAAYWFTASTSFANPAVTLARAATNTFVGIRPADTPAFLLAQIGGAVAGTMVFRWLTPRCSNLRPNSWCPTRKSKLVRLRCPQVSIGCPMRMLTRFLTK